MTDRCRTCNKYLPEGGVVVIGKRFCAPVTSECVYIGQQSRNWSLSVAEAQQMLNQLFDEREGAA